MATDGNSTLQALPVTGKCPRFKDDSSQVGKKMKCTRVYPVCDEVIKEPTKTKRVMKPFIVMVTMKLGFTVDVLVYRYLTLLSSKMMTRFSFILIASLRLIKLNWKHLNPLFTLYQLPLPN